MPPSMAFAPDVHVFPGGRVDPADAHPSLVARSAISPEQAAAALGGDVPPTRAITADQPAATPSTTRKPAITTTPKPPAVYYKNCGVALAEGAAPIAKGEPGYRTGLDPDGDGVACPVD